MLVGVYARRQRSIGVYQSKPPESNRGKLVILFSTCVDGGSFTRARKGAKSRQFAGRAKGRFGHGSSDTFAKDIFSQKARQVRLKGLAGLEGFEWRNKRALLVSIPTLSLF